MTSVAQPGRLAARRVIFWAAALVTLSLLVMAYAAIRAFETSIAPEMERRTQLIGSTVREELERALDFGIPLEAIGGTAGYIEDILADFPEVERVALLSTFSWLLRSRP